MKPILFLMICLLGAIASLGAQDNKFDRLEQYGEWRAATAGFNNPQLWSSAMTLGLNCYLTRNLTIGIPLELDIALMNNRSVKKYQPQGTLGLSAGYDLNFDKSKLRFSVAVGNTLANNDVWKYHYYDCGLRFGQRQTSNNLYVGVGVRYYDAYGTTFIDNQTTLYTALGVWF